MKVLGPRRIVSNDVSVLAEYSMSVDLVQCRTSASHVEHQKKLQFIKSNIYRTNAITLLSSVNIFISLKMFAWAVCEHSTEEGGMNGRKAAVGIQRWSG